MEIRLRAARRGVLGFTLIELMVTILIVSVLVSFAIPAYQSQVRKSRRTEARTALLDLAAREERYMAAKNSYTDVATDLGYTSTELPGPVGSGYYKLEVTSVAIGTAAAAPTFVLTASAVAGAGQDKDTSCAKFIVDQTGAQTSKDSGGAVTTSCWK